jgi:hypothetical protein
VSLCSNRKKLVAIAISDPILQLYALRGFPGQIPVYSYLFSKLFSLLKIKCLS